MKRLRSYLPFIGLLIIVACAAPKLKNSSDPKNIFVLIPDLSGKTGKIIVKNDAGEQTITSPGAVVEVKNEQTSPQQQKSLTNPEIEAIFEDAIRSRPGSSVHYILYFKHDIPELTESSQKTLSQIANRIIKAVNDCRSCDILIIGHTDTTGTDSYNLKLGLARARLIADKLIELGISSDRTDITSHGEKDLFISTLDNVLEPRNRRVEVIVR